MAGALHCLTIMNSIVDTLTLPNGFDATKTTVNLPTLKKQILYKINMQIHILKLLNKFFQKKLQ